MSVTKVTKTTTTSYETKSSTNHVANTTTLAQLYAQRSQLLDPMAYHNSMMGVTGDLYSMTGGATNATAHAVAVAAATAAASGTGYITNQYDMSTLNPANITYLPNISPWKQYQ